MILAALIACLFRPDPLPDRIHAVTVWAAREYRRGGISPGAYVRLFTARTAAHRAWYSGSRTAWLLTVRCEAMAVCEMLAR